MVFELGGEKNKKTNAEGKHAIRKRTKKTKRNVLKAQIGRQKLI